MSITLKNITSGDTISSMVDKINYNFDQLILNGGGIEGPQGIEGQPGMQGLQGEQGEHGEKGDTGIRGTYFHKMPTAVVRAINHANPLPRTDDDGIDFLENDIIIALKLSDGIYLPEYLYRVIIDTDDITQLIVNYICDFSEETKLFNEFNDLDSGSGYTQTINRLIRTNPTPTIGGNTIKRGLILNDYENITTDYVYDNESGSGSGNGINTHFIDEVILHNNVLVCTNTESSEDTNGSPHGGIVFYDWPDCLTNKTKLSDFPRINYTSSTEKTLNICSPKQDISIKAENNVNISSNVGEICLKIFNNDISNNKKGLIVKGKDPKRITDQLTKEYFNIKSVIDNSSNTNSTIANIIDTIYTDKFIIKNFNDDYGSDDGNSTFLTINEISVPTSTTNKACGIELNKNEGTYIYSKNIISVGKESKNYINGTNQNAVNNYYAQSRIVLNNDDTNLTENSTTEIIGKKIKIAQVQYIPDVTNPKRTNAFILNDTYPRMIIPDFGIFIEKEDMQFYSQFDAGDKPLYPSPSSPFPGGYARRDTKRRRQFANISLNTKTQYKEKISLRTSYPGVIEFSNATEYYNSFILNYTDETIEDYSSIRICTDPMLFRESSSGFNAYSHLNSYCNMGVLNINNMGTVHSGTIKFQGKILNALNAEKDSEDNIIYNFIRIGNVVHCQFSGTIYTKNTYIPKITAQSPAINNVVYIKGNDDTYWGPSNDGYYKYNESSYELEEKHKFYYDWPSGTMNAYLYVNLYPPIVKTTKSTDGSYTTNIKNLIGHFTCKYNDTYYERVLSYDSTLVSAGTVAGTDGGINYYKIPKILMREVTSMSENDFILSANFVPQFAEFYGYFSYVIDTDEIHNSKLKHRNTTSVAEKRGSLRP